MVSGPLGFSRPFSGSSVSLVVLDTVPISTPRSQGIEDRILTEVGVQTDVSSMDVGGEVTIEVEFDEQVNAEELSSVLELLPKDRDRIADESFITVTEPKGAFDGPRPLVSSSLEIEAGFDTSGTQLEAMSTSQRRDSIETTLRENSPILVDVTFTTSTTRIIIRQERVQVASILDLFRAIDQVTEQTGARISTDVVIQANGG